jgi:hypothetical protein
MSRRSQSRRRRSYGRRQHETREKRYQHSAGWLAETPLDSDWSMDEASDDRPGTDGDPYAGLSR